MDRRNFFSMLVAAICAPFVGCQPAKKKKTVARLGVLNAESVAKVQKILHQRRRDPTHWRVLPLPVRYE